MKRYRPPLEDLKIKDPSSKEDEEPKLNHWEIENYQF